MPVIGLCSQEEFPTDMFVNLIGPFILGLLLISFFLSSLVLQYLGYYHTLFTTMTIFQSCFNFQIWRQLFSFGPILHHSQFSVILIVLNKLGVNRKFVSPEEKNKILAKMTNLVLNASAEVINTPNPVAGDTWLHTALSL